MTAADVAAQLVADGAPDDNRAPITALFERVLAAIGAGATDAWWVPGRLEVFGKHTDYAGGRSLVCAVPRGFAVAARPRADEVVTVTDAGGGGTFALSRGAAPDATGWRRYVLTVVRRLSTNFPDACRGADIALVSNLPRASGMSSSSALVVAVAAALVRIRELDRTETWREHIPDPLSASAYYACVENGSRFGPFAGDEGVGTHGGSEDHAAIVTATPNALSTFAFVPLRLLERVAMPADWTFVVAPSGARAEKTGGARDRYNRLSSATACLLALWNAHNGSPEASLGAALGSSGSRAVDDLHALIDAETPAAWDADALHRRLAHFVREDARVVDAAAAFASADRVALGALSADSQDDADRLLGNQVDETRALVASARRLGAIGACSFGAGFGGSAWAVVERDRGPRFARDWNSGAFSVRPSPPLTAFTGEAGGRLL